MSSTDKVSGKEIIVAVAVLVVVAVGIIFSLGIFAGESQQKEVIVSDAGAKAADHVEVYVKLISIDPIKGDANVRMEFLPHGKIIAEDGSLAQDVKFYVPSANGKTEVEFKKGKNFAPVEAVLSMYGGNATDYPFDSHRAGFYLYLDRTAPEKKDDAKPAPAGEQHETSPEQSESEIGGIPLDVSFFGSIPGYRINVEKGKDSDETYVVGEISIERSNTVVAFSIFVGLLMWALATATLFLVTSLLIRGRKIEINMFSFMAALLFAFYNVRNSQAAVPPIGTFSDFLFFFWAEALVALCLVAAVLTWVFRTAKP